MGLCSEGLHSPLARLDCLLDRREPRGPRDQALALSPQLRTFPFQLLRGSDERLSCGGIVRCAHLSSRAPRCPAGFAAVPAVAAAFTVKATEGGAHLGGTRRTGGA
jgi:hypothetical protein